MTPSWIRALLARSLCRPVRGAQTRTRLGFEALENRRTPATFTVLNKDNAGIGSLRQAILDANAAAGADTIVFDAAYFSAVRTIALTSQLTITDAVTITGPGAKLASVSGNKASRVFNISIPGAGGSVGLSGLTITEGKALNGGGIIFQDEALTVTECDVVGNFADGDGGGIHMTAGGSLTVRRSTLSGNSADWGGAINTYQGGGSIVVENSTISGNSALIVGGGIYFIGTAGSGVTIRNSTITANSATGNDGGVFRNSASPAISLESSIVSGNTSGGAPDIFSNLAVLANFSAVGAKTGFPSLTGSSNLPFGADLKLGPLGYNGGPTQTHALLAGSAAINTGSNPSGLTVDQRGLVRTWNGQIDIGAVESDPSFVVRNTNNAGKDSLRQQVLDANAFAGANKVTFDPAVFTSVKTITLASDMTITDAATITGPTAGVIVSGGSNTRIFNATPAPAGSLINFAMLTLTAGGAIGRGGAFFGDNQFVTFTDCFLTNNSSSTHGGAISFDLEGPSGKLTLVRCGLVANHAVISGGGIDAYGTSITIQNSTLAGNSAKNTGFGGAISVSAPTLTIANSTLSGNRASIGGAIQAFYTTVSIQNSTITGNSADFGGGLNLQSGPALSLESSIVSGNSGGSAPDIASAIAVTANFSAVGSSSGFPSLAGTGNQGFGADLKLAPLADNGGPTQTHALLPGSLAVDAGSNPTGLPIDQRGSQRVVGSQIDIGAIEAVNLLVVNNADAGSGSLRQTIRHANSVAGANSITFDPTAFASAKTLTLATGELSITDPVTIAGPGAKLATVSGNNASRLLSINIPGAGGGVVMSGLTLTGGKANNGGGLLLQDDALTLVECAVVANAGSGNGGGIHVQGGGSVTVRRTTISGNLSNVGAAINFYPSGGSLLVENSTISNNSAIIGGGIYFRGVAGSGITIRNSTITGNSATVGSGGGIFRYSGPGINLESSIVSGNSGGSAPDISSGGIAVTANFSAVGSNAGFSSLTGSNNLPFGANLKLGSLADNGGATRTHALLSGSSAINAGNLVGAPATDQRGLPRIVGTTDIGAFELQPAVKVASVVVGNGTVQRSMVTQIQVTFDSSVVFNGNPAAAFQLVRSKDAAAVNLAAAVSGYDVTLTFTGGAVDGKSLSDGRYTLKVLAGQIGGEGLDGDGNGIGGDDYVLIGNPTAAPKLFRLFGDADGDGDSDAVDFGQFRSSFGGASNLAFDSDGDGDVDAVDFGQFRQRFGSSV